MIPDFLKMGLWLGRSLFTLTLVCSALAAQAQATSWPYHINETWLLIDSKSATLSVMRGNAIVQRFSDVAFGTLGTKPVHFLNDSSTPMGEFRIDGINRNSRYALFFSLNYPTLVHAKKALDDKKITVEQYLAIFNASLQGQAPPYTTPLGGMIGIHGLGKASLAVHKKYNWTRGCVAMTNDQIYQLAKHARIGMRVIIQ